MKRREMILAAGSLAALACPLFAFAQASTKPARVGTMWAGTSSGSAHLMRGFLAGMQDAGFVEGRNIVYETAFADGKPEHLKTFAAGLARSKVEVIFAAGNAAVDAARQAAPSTPIVFALTGDPLLLGFVKSLNRPGGNLTGTSLVSGDLIGKRIEILREMLPGAARLGVLYRAADPNAPIVVPVVEEIAKRVGLEVLKVPASESRDLDPAFAQFAAARADAVMVVDNPVFHGLREAIIVAAAKQRLPTVHGNPEFIDLGGLLSYGTDLANSCRQAARLVAKILRGAKPAELPVEQPTKFDLIVNLKTARTLGIKVPQSVILRADRVIE